MIEEMERAIRAAGRVFLIGNGGSYANAMHIANDLIACGVDARTLDPATLTATANDYGYEQIFSRWLHTLGKKDDVLIALSGSGTSKNIVQAIETAKARKMKVFLVTGFLRSMDMQQSEEEQVALGHKLMRLLKNG